jgi:hypothetical protein
MSGDIKSARLIILKGMLFLLTGLIAFGLICLSAKDWGVVFCLVICIWAFCRFYYFAFYVIEKYVDPEFKFSGLYAFGKYLLSRR